MMTWASPERWWWIALAVPIVLLYILRTRPRRQSVATLMFWDQIFDESRQRAWWQNLRRWVSLLLQLIFVALVIAAILDPILGGLRDAKDIVLVIDNSASMNVSSDESTTRLDQAINQAKVIAKGMRDGDTMAVITAGGPVRVVSGQGDFAPAITDAIDTIRPTDNPTRIDDAIAVARRVANDATRRQIIVLSDQSIDIKPDGDRDNPKEGTQEIVANPIGVSSGNVAITAMVARRSLADPAGFSTWIRLQRFDEAGSDPIRVRLTLSLTSSDDNSEAEIFDVIPITLGPNQSWQQTITGNTTAGGRLIASIEGSENLTTQTNGLVVDDVARCVLPPRPLVPARIVHASGSKLDSGLDSDESTPTDFFLSSVLGSIDALDLQQVAPDTEIFAGITVLVGDVPSPLPSGPLLVVSPQTSLDGVWTIGDEIESPMVTQTDGQSPLMRHVRLTNVPLDVSRPIEVDESIGPSTPLIRTAGDRVVATAIDRPQGRILVLSTRLDGGDFPLRIGFPVMMTNAVNWFLRRSGELEPPIRTGTESRLMTSMKGQQLKLETEASTVNLRRDGDNLDIPPIDQVGWGRLASESPVTSMTPDATTQWVAINLCDASESDIRMPERNSDRVMPKTAIAGGRPPWVWLAILALLLIVIEWGLFQRRVVA